MQDNRILFLFDPLCGWCYGAEPMLDRLRADGTVIDPIPTGLFSGNGARPMDAGFASYAWENDQRIASLSGQTFSAAYRENVLKKPGAMFDSGPATLAILAAGREDPALRFKALHLLQSARYVDGRDIADPHVVAELLEGAGLADAARLLRNPYSEFQTFAQETVGFGRDLYRQMNARGVPALIIEKAGQRQLLGADALFGDLATLKALIAAI